MKAISSMATRHLLAELSEWADGRGAGRLEVESVGGVDAARRVAAGEPFDLVFLASDALDALAAAGHVDAASITPLALSQVGIAMRAVGVEAAAAAMSPAFDDAAGVRGALRTATRIGYSTGPSGTALVRHIEDWGLAGELEGRLVQASAGVPVARLVSEGAVDLGFQQLSELVGQPGIRVLGVLPPDCAIDTVFAGAVATVGSDRERAAALLALLASGEAAPLVTARFFAVP